MSQYRLKECAPPVQSGKNWRLEAGSDAPAYHVQVLLPEGEAPPSGWPALVLLDGQGLAGTFDEAVRRLSRRCDATGVLAMAIIGVTAEPARDVDHRKRDFATPRKDAGGPQYDAGAFLQRIAGLIPVLASRHELDPRRLALFGHSLAGYFALHALGSRASPFGQFVAISPSIWWDREHLHERIAQIDCAGQRAFLAIGEWEEAVPPWQSGHPLAEAALERRLGRRMIANLQDMAESLAMKLGDEAVFMRLFDDEDHASILTRSVAPVLRFVSQGWDGSCQTKCAAGVLSW